MQQTHCYPVMRFREGLQSVGLLRKSRSTLHLTKAGEAALGDTVKLVDHLARRLIPKSGETFDVQATLLILTYAAASTGAAMPYPTITALLAELGWRYPSGGVPSVSDLYHLPVHDFLLNMSDEPVTRTRRNIVSTAAATLARRALMAPG